MTYDRGGMARVDPLELALRRAFGTLTGPGTPPGLAAALAHAVFPGGARVRPQLAIAVARACAGRLPMAVRDVAVALELVHCASLVHDDLPCFDNAPLRRGRPSVHAQYGESTAVLVGDALIAGAFELLGRACSERASLLPTIGILAAAVGARSGLVAGQAWETEEHADIGRYHRAKTGALFEAAVRMGAIAGGGRPEAWHELGETIGYAYQIADDILDCTACASEVGKPVGQDLLLGRPSAVLQLGLDGPMPRSVARSLVARIRCRTLPARRSSVRGSRRSSIACSLRSTRQPLRSALPLPSAHDRCPRCAPMYLRRACGRSSTRRHGPPARSCSTG